MNRVRSLIACAALFAVSAPASGQAGGLVWPNARSKANSDPWLVANHDRIVQMRPRLLVLNFANGVSNSQARTKVDALIAALRESSRYHGYKDASATPFLEYQVARLVDLTDRVPPQEPLDRNSTKYPRIANWHEGINFVYARLFQSEFAALYGYPDTKHPGRYLPLAELVDRGIINEVWFIAYQGKYGAPYESVEVKQTYDDHFRKYPGKWVQAGNGGDAGQPFIGRSLRILFINAERGPGCAMESLGHSLEGMSNSRAIPYLTPYFIEYSGFDLDKRYGMPFSSLYGREGSEMSYPDPTTISFTWKGEKKTYRNYVPAGNNVHFLPNGRKDYDLDDPAPVMSTIEHFRLHDAATKHDMATLWTPAVLDRYRELGRDCMGRWVIYWRQNMPGLHNRAKDDFGRPMKNWWPFLFY